MKIGIIIPSFNEEINLPYLIREIEAQNTGAEICVVDDSPRNAGDLAAKAPGCKNLTVIRRSAKKGRGSAVLEGIKHFLKSPCDIIVEMDADFSHPPSQLAGLIRKSREGKTDILIASRYLKESVIENWPMARRVFSKAANVLAGILLGVPIKDYTNGFRVYSRRAAEAVSSTCGNCGGGFIVLSEILVNLYYRNYSIAEASMVFTDRTHGKSSVGCREIIGACAGLIKIWRLKKRIQKDRSSGKRAGMNTRPVLNGFGGEYGGRSPDF